MPTEILKQLRALREGVAESLRKDPRFLTLSALDRSITEIAGVLTTSGLMTPDVAAPLSQVGFEGVPASGTHAAPAAAGAGPAAHGASPTYAAAAPGAHPEAASVMSPQAAAAAAAEAPAKKKKKKSLIKPLMGAAAVLAAGGLAAEVIGAERRAAAKPPAHAGSEKEGEAASDAEDDPGAHGAAPPGSPTAGRMGRAAPGASEDGEDAQQAQEHGDATADPAGVVPEGKASGYVPMQAREGAPQYQPSIYIKFGKPPAKVDLRSLMTPIENQGDTNSCVANAVAGAYQYWIKKTTKQDQDISRLFIYYNARWRDGSQDKDEGSVIQLAMEGLQKFGACFEKEWPFDPHLVLKKPGADAYKDGAPNRVQDMAQVPLKLEAWKQALAEGKPIVFGCALFDSFDECSKKGGVVPMPSPEDVARAKHSGHSMCAVGYNDGEKVFIVRNSWGTDWGDQGYCYMPYDYLLNPKFNDGDCWVFVPKVPSQPPREVWSDTTDPVTNGGQGVDFPIVPFSIADYEHLAVDLFAHVRKPFNSTILANYAEYVTAAGKGLWSELERFDVRTFLASTAALTGVASWAAEEFLSESTETTETSETLMSDEEDNESEDDDSDDDNDSGDDDSDDDDDDDDEADDDDADDDDSDDDDSDDDSSEDADDDDDDDDDDADDDDSDEDSDDEDGDGDAESDGDENAEDDDSDDDDADEDGDSDGDDSDDDDSDDDDSDDDDGGDDSNDDGGDDDGGDDD